LRFLHDSWFLMFGSRLVKAAGAKVALAEKWNGTPLSAE